MRDSRATGAREFVADLTRHPGFAGTVTDIAIESGNARYPAMRVSDRPGRLESTDGIAGLRVGIALDRAESALTAFLALPPASGRGQGSGYPLAHYRLALVYEQRGEFAKARAEVATALQLFPEYKLAREAEQRLRGRNP